MAMMSSCTRTKLWDGLCAAADKVASARAAQVHATTRKVMRGPLSLFSRSRGRQLVVLEHFAQRQLVDLAGGAEWDFFDEHDVIRRPPFGDLAVESREHLLTRGIGAG